MARSFNAQHCSPIMARFGWGIQWREVNRFNNSPQFLPFLSFLPIEMECATLFSHYGQVWMTYTVYRSPWFLSFCSFLFSLSLFLFSFPFFFLLNTSPSTLTLLYLSSPLYTLWVWLLRMRGSCSLLVSHSISFIMHSLPLIPLQTASGHRNPSFCPHERQSTSHLKRVENNKKIPITNGHKKGHRYKKTVGK